MSGVNASSLVLRQCLTPAKIILKAGWFGSIWRTERSSWIPLPCAGLAPQRRKWSVVSLTDWQQGHQPSDSSCTGDWRKRRSPSGSWLCTTYMCRTWFDGVILRKWFPKVVKSISFHTESDHPFLSWRYCHKWYPLMWYLIHALYCPVNRSPLIDTEQCWVGSWATLATEWRRPRCRYRVARKSASTFSRVENESFSYEARLSWCPLTQTGRKDVRSSRRKLDIMDIRSASYGMTVYTELCSAKRWTRCMAAWLSQYQRTLHLCFRPQCLDNDIRNRRDDASPHSSHRVDESVPNGPSTGPEHLNSTCFFVEMSQSNVPCRLWRTPSGAIYILDRARQARHARLSEATCSIWSRRRWCRGGRLLINEKMLSWCIRGEEETVSMLITFAVRLIFQYGTYRRNEDLM